MLLTNAESENIVSTGSPKTYREYLTTVRHLCLHAAQQLIVLSDHLKALLPLLICSRRVYGAQPASPGTHWAKSHLQCYADVERAVAAVCIRCVSANCSKAQILPFSTRQTCAAHASNCRPVSPCFPR